MWFVFAFSFFLDRGLFVLSCIVRDDSGGSEAKKYREMKKRNVSVGAV